MWLAVALFASLGLVIVLGASSTARYELERSGAPSRRDAVADATAGDPQASTAAPTVAPQQPAAARNSPGSQGSAQPAAVHRPAAQATPAPVPVATHPAGRLTALAPMATGWWLVDGPGAPLAGPFDDEIDAEWAAFALALPETARAVYGAQREDGSVLRRQSPQERAWLEELGRQLDRLPVEWTAFIEDDDALTTLAVDVTAALLEAGLPLHDCDDQDADAPRSGGACLTPHPESGGLVVTWRQHDRMSVQQVRGTEAGDAVQFSMTVAVANVLTQLGFVVEPYGTTGGYLVTPGGR
ncbi:hypothetical protein BKA19_3111 [Blastococcus saxobsidens]|uniref:Uncharacterized protein n=2 Tax=Blastococcus saxobsidens TaxID=138336 RepID=A0A4Q7Y8S6_9ACTN|nr:hypothetical protein BKA19_3111 [Blastococcus saxobsidens]